MVVECHYELISSTVVVGCHYNYHTNYLIEHFTCTLCMLWTLFGLVHLKATHIFILQIDYQSRKYPLYSHRLARYTCYLYLQAICDTLYFPFMQYVCLHRYIGDMCSITEFFFQGSSDIRSIFFRTISCERKLITFC